MDKNPIILIIGDVMLDEYRWGEAKRISPEEPVPVLDFLKVTYALGGAANVAANIKSLGGEPIILGVIGDDEAGGIFRNILRERGIEASGIAITDRLTTVKSRIMAGRRQVLRVDTENRSSVSESVRKKILQLFKKNLSQARAVVVSDYAKGLLNRALARQILALAAKRGIPVLVDTKPFQADFYAGAFVFTPNENEAKGIAGGDGGVEKLGSVLTRKLRGNVLITQGEKGMTLFLSGGGHKYFSPKHPKKVFDVIGAGDTVIATLAYFLSRGDTLEHAAFLANRAGGIVVGKPETAQVSMRELRDDLYPHEAKIKTISQLAAISRLIRAGGGKTVLTTGCFDILHSGHMDLFNEAHKSGDVLIVGANSDGSIRRLKGAGRPIIREKERLFNLASLMNVDYVTVFNEEDPSRIIERLKPDVFVKGGDWQGKKMPEKKTLQKYGGKLVLLPIKIPASTTVIAKKIYDES